MKKQPTPATRPMNNADMGPTKPDAGVMATRPATHPEIAPNALGLPLRIHSAAAHPMAAAAAAKWVATKALVAPIWKQSPNNLGSLRQSLAARGNTPGAVDIERTGGTLTLQFERHKLGGLVQVTVNGESRTVDLYSPETGVETLTWQPDLAA